MKTEVTYASKAALKTVAPSAIAIHCGDPRFQDAFREFLTEGLGLISYALIAIPGGGHFPSLTEIMPKFAKTGFQSLSFFVERTDARRIIVIDHEECQFFKEQLRYYFTESDRRSQQLASLRKARALFCERFEHHSIEMYFAAASSDNRIQFLKVE